VLRAGTQELYQVESAKLTGVATAGVWFPVYVCRRIELRESSGEVLPACFGLEFELADFELQPLPPRYAITAPRHEPINTVAVVIDLVGTPPRQPMIERSPSEGQALRIASEARLLLPGKGGGT
jgi:hypothetical protein